MTFNYFEVLSAPSLMDHQSQGIVQIIDTFEIREGKVNQKYYFRELKSSVIQSVLYRFCIIEIYKKDSLTVRL